MGHSPASHPLINDLVQQAVALEGQGQPEHARDTYVKAVELLLQQLRVTDDALERETITTRANALLRAAEALPHGELLHINTCKH